MEYLVVSATGDIVGGLEVSDSGKVSFPVPFRLILIRKISFQDRHDWNSKSLEKFVNDFGKNEVGSRWKNVMIEPSFIPAGSFYPRIARPTTDHPKDAPIGFGLTNSLRGERSQAVNQLRALTKLLAEIADVVELEPRNLLTYGPKTRNLLILAATEFEAVAKGVLRANSYAKMKTNIRDYELLKEPMMLSQYRVKFGDFPQIPEVLPFNDWGNGENLSWYKAYNDSKHDRYLNFAEANLINSITSLAACFVMLCACFGWREVYGIGNQLGLGMAISKFPEWPLGELYRRPKGPVGPYNAGDISKELSFNFNP